MTDDVPMFSMDDATPGTLATVLGISEPEARFILAIHRGEIDGDVVELPSTDVSAPGA